MTSKIREGPATKRARFAETNGAANTKSATATTKTFDGVPAIQAALAVNGGQPSTTLVETLTALRNQLSLRHTELQTLIDNAQKTATTSTKGTTSGSYLNSLPTVIQPNDPRLLLLETWCSSSPGLEELFVIWDAAASSVPASASWKSAAANQGPVAMAASISTLVLNILTSVLSLLSAYYTFQAHGAPVLKNLYENERWRRLCGYVTGNGNDLILVALRLLAVVVEKWDGKKVLDGFTWESKVLTKLLQMRRKGTSSHNLLVKPDIRTAYTLFLLSFLLPSPTNSQTKAAFLQQYSFHYTSIFKNLHQDSPDVVRRVLEVSWEGVWSDIRVSRSLKVGIFAGPVLSNLLKLYDRSSEEDSATFTVADLVHHFLLAICTRPGIGLCFKDRGWYPRDVDGDTLFADGSNPTSNPNDHNDGDDGKSKPKIYNPTLLTLLKQLKPTDDPRQNELALKILHVAPELVSLYLPQSGLTLDPPRLSSKWIANLCFFVSVVGTNGTIRDIEREGGFAIDESAENIVYRPTPPPLSTVVNNVTPGGGPNRLNLRNVFTKGLQFVPATKGAASGASGNLVQHTTALALIRCLNKLRRVREAMEGVARALGEGEVVHSAAFGVDGAQEEEGLAGPREGLWTKRTREVVKEVRRRVPEFQVVLAFCNAHLKTTAATVTATGDDPVKGEREVGEGEKVKKELMAECAMRLLWMYQEALPEVVEEARFDVGKVLLGFDVAKLRGPEKEDEPQEQRGEDDEEDAEDGGDEDGGEQDDHEGPAEETKPQEPAPLSTELRLRRLTQLHILRFLGVSPAFSFSAPSPTHPGHTHLYSLLLGIAKLGSTHDQISDELKRLVCRVLGRSIVFNWAAENGNLVGEDSGEGGEVEVWLESLPVGLRRVREVKRLVDVTEADDEEGAGEEQGEGEGKTVTVYPETLDGTPLTDERTSVVAFLEDCIVRCAKTPYKYIEELEKMAGSSSSSASASAHGASVLPSPLVVTVVEQLEAKLGARLLSPSDVLAVVTYLRTLVFALVGKLETGFSASSSPSESYLNVLGTVLDRAAALVAPGSEVWKKAFGDEEHALVKAAVKREVGMARRCLGLRKEGGDVEMPVDEEGAEEDRDVDDFLDLVEALEIPSPVERRLTIYELVDWVRLLGVPLNQGQTNRLWGAVEEVWPEGLGQVVRYLDVPDLYGDLKEAVSVWEVLVKKDDGGKEEEEDDGMDVDENENDNEDEGGGEDDAESDASTLPFEYLLVHALPRHLLDPNCQEILVECALNYCEASPNESPSASTSSTPSPGSIAPHKLHYVVRHILRRFSMFLAIRQVDAAKDLLMVLAGALEKVKVEDGRAFEGVKPTVFAGLKELVALTTSSSTSTALDAELLKGVRAGLLRVQDVTLDPRVRTDRTLVAETASFWVEVLKTLLGREEDDVEASQDAAYAGFWIRFAQPVEVLDLLAASIARPAVLLDENTGKPVASKAAEIVGGVMQLCLRALKDASRSRGGLKHEFYAQLRGYPGALDLLVRAYTLLVSLRAGADGEREGVMAGGVKTVEELVAAMQESEGVPVGLDGASLITGPDVSLTYVLENAEARWSAARRAKENVDGGKSTTVGSFLSQPLEEWTNATEKVVCNFLYRLAGGNGAVEKEVLRWLLSEEGGMRAELVEGGEKVVGVAHALLDCLAHRAGTSALEDDATASRVFDVLLTHLLVGGARKGQAKEGLRWLFGMAQDEEKVQALLSLLDKRLKPLKKAADGSKTSDVLTAELVALVAWLNTLDIPSKKGRERVSSIVDDVVEVGVQWLVRRLSDEEGQKELEEDTTAVCVELAKAMRHDGVACKAASLETVLGVVIQSQYHIAHPECLEVLEVGLGRAGLKPLIVNKYLQGVIQHPHFYKLAIPASSATNTPAPLSKIRDPLISLLHVLFYLHPANTCQVSHIEPLIRVYGGTLAVSDRKILSIFRLFERQRKLSVRTIVGRWSPPSSSLAGSIASSTSVGLEALQNLDPILVLRTGLSYPTRGVDDDMDPELDGSDKKTRLGPSGFELQLYDPIFLLLLLQHVLANGPPASAIAWIELFRSNVFGLAIRALSAREGRVRELGMGCIVGLWNLMQNADLQERDYVLHLLGLLKNVIPAPTKTTGRMFIDGAEGGDESEAWYAPRLPSYSTLLLFHALRGIFNPSSFVYPLTSRFLLQRPELDITDVPMLYNMLYSSDTDDWKKERGWIMRFLADGVLTGSAVADWKLLKRRHVWDLVASMYQGASASVSTFSLNEGGGQVAGSGDKALKHGVLEFLVNVTRHRGPTMSLILKSGLLAWIEMQLRVSDQGGVNALEWARILENVIVVVDVGKMEAGAMKGQWARIIARCVEIILKESLGSSTLLAVLPVAVRIVNRLSTFASIGHQTLSSVLAQCMDALKTFEANIKGGLNMKTGSTVAKLDDIVSPPLHSSHDLHGKQIVDEETTVIVWGRLVELLWQAGMRVGPGDSAPKTWDQLTSRLLLWRSMVGAESSSVGEWVRVECVENLGRSDSAS